MTDIVHKAAEIRGAQQQFDMMMETVTKVLDRANPQMADLVEARRQLLQALRRTRPKEPAPVEVPEPTPELVRALQRDLVGPDVLDPLTRAERERVLAQQAPARWVRNLLKAALAMAAETKHAVTDHDSRADDGSGAG
jgi:hypothetical protein